MFKAILDIKPTCLRFFAVLSLISISFSFIDAQTTRSRTTSQSRAASQSPGDTSVIPRFIGAIQKRDFKTVIDSTFHYQSEMARIKEQNPKILWDKLLSEYYNEKISKLSVDQGYWGNYAETLLRATGDPVQNIRAAILYLPPSCKWTISESRTQSLSDSLTYGPHTRTIVYVIVNYPSIETSPATDKGRLKQALLVFTIRGGTQLIMDIGRIEKGDVYWPIPALSLEAASRMVQEYFSYPNTSLRLTVSLNPNIYGSVNDYGWETFSNNTKRLEALLQRLGFSFIKSFNLGPGFYHTEAIMKPPEKWQPFVVSYNSRKLLSGDQTYIEIGTLSYILNESTEVAVANFEQTEGNGVATVQIRFKGCTPICQALQPAKKEIETLGQWGKSVFRDVEPADIANKLGKLAEKRDIVEQQWSVDFVWNAQNGWKIEKITEIPGAQTISEKPISPDVNVPEESKPPERKSIEPTVSSEAACRTYDSCVSEGLASIKSQNWEKALLDFQKASSLEPSKPHAWAGIGRLYLATDRRNEVSEMWDKALQLGGTVSFEVCRERGLSCDRGLFTISAKEVSFTDERGNKEFVVPAAQVETKGVHNFKGKAGFFRLRTNNKNYNFYYFPDGVNCDKTFMVECPEAGVTQQLFVANYVTSAISNLSKGLIK